MGPINLVLWVGGAVLVWLGYGRARGPWARYQELKAQDANVARYEAWRGGVRDDAGTTGASVAMAILASPGSSSAPAIAVAGLVVDRPGLRRPLTGRRPPARGQRGRIRRSSIAVQRSMTTARPAAAAIRAASQFTTPSWSHRQRAPIATASCGVRARTARSAGRRRRCRTGRSPRPPRRASGRPARRGPRGVFGLTGTQS